jgi:hypothetical protein
MVGRKRVEDTPFVVEVLENPWSKKSGDNRLEEYEEAKPE